MNHILIRNILKFTIGLPIIIIFSLSIFLVLLVGTPILFIVSLCHYVIYGINPKEDIKNFIISGINAIKSMCKPIRY